MEVKSFVPQNPLLRNFIECFYTLTRRADEKDDVYVAFPNVTTILCLNKQTKFELIENVRTVTHCPENEIQSKLICHFRRAERIRFHGENDEISVIFKPLGINAFLDRDLRFYVKSEFADFDPFADFQSKILEIFSIKGDEQRIEALEDYWTTNFVGFRHPFLSPIVGELLENDCPFSLSETARKIGISRTTLVKHFDSHLCTTPSHFKKIARFRRAMKQQRNKLAEENLTAVSYGAEYFDQSHMIKDFKSLTSFAPKSFFSNITSLENGKINWMFL